MLKLSCPILDILNRVEFHFLCLYLFCDDSKAIANAHGVSDMKENNPSH